METYFDSHREIMPALKNLIHSAEHSVLGIGVAFGTSMNDCGDLIRNRMNEGILFTFICLSRTADFQFCAPRWGRPVDVIRTCVDASLQALATMKAAAPSHFSFHATDDCPPCRIYVADRDFGTPRGILVFPNTGVNGRGKVGVYVPDFLASQYQDDYAAALNWMNRQVKRKVFVIHGHNEPMRRELEDLLKALGVEPVVLVDKVAGGATTIIEKFEEHARECSFAIALLTPDDKVENDGREYSQPRGNVLWEMGWFSSRLTRKRVVLLTQRGLETGNYMSNMLGVLPHVFSESVTECAPLLREELSRAGLIF